MDIVLEAITKLEAPRRGIIRNPSGLLKSLILDLADLRRSNGTRIPDGRPVVDAALDRLYVAGIIPQGEVVTDRGMEIVRKCDEARVLQTLETFHQPSLKAISRDNPFTPQLLSRLRNCGAI